ncbi:hypothetical protein DFH06DRAFT_1421138 [Mycena polygramma]|nr:hypothetical protein DFH06DRAFT_1421138 [Mycena polygramma]
MLNKQGDELAERPRFQVSGIRVGYVQETSSWGAIVVSLELHSLTWSKNECQDSKGGCKSVRGTTSKKMRVLAGGGEEAKCLAPSGSRVLRNEGSRNEGVQELKSKGCPMDRKTSKKRYRGGKESGKGLETREYGRKIKFELCKSEKSLRVLENGRVNKQKGSERVESSRDERSGRESVRTITKGDERRSSVMVGRRS